MTALSYKGRLPGVVCEAALPRRESNPLRLDVAGFVGFAERGPLNTPVPLEDVSQYQAIFGGDLLVARSEGLPIYAYLPRAVQSFFDNGGRRCYVVRVAREDPAGVAHARPNRFAIPGMVAWDGAALRRVVAPAAWPGSWSDRMQVGTQLLRRPLRLAAGPGAYRPDPATGTLALDLEVPAAATVQPGDVLELHFADGAGLLLRAATVALREAPEATLRARPITVTAAAPLALRPATAAPAAAPDQVERLDGTGWQSLPAALGPLAAADGGFTCSLAETPAVQAGDLLRLSFAGAALLFPVARVDWAYDAATDTRFQQAFGRRLLAPIDLGAIGGALTQVDYLSFDLLIREGSQTREHWPDARFGSWTERLMSGSVSVGELGQRSLRLGAPAPAAMLPLGMDDLPIFRRPLPDPDPSGKDGLDSFDPAALFLDPQFAGYGVRTLIGRAEELLYLSTPPGRLVKLHSLIPVSEVALIALPDLLHRRWEPAAAPPAEPPVEPPPAEPAPDRSRFRDCPAPPPPPPPPPPVEPLEVLGDGEDLLPEQFAQQLAAAPLAVPPAEYGPADLDALVGVQEALVSLCAARADALAVLGAPAHFARRELVDWHTQLTGLPGFRDGNPLSYAAAYHGWTQIPEPATAALAPLRSLPPDGAVCGLIAAREARRGPWVAPANESLRGVVGLTPELGEDDWLALFDLQLNLVRQQPGRFTLLSAHTLSSDPQLWQVSVRRLLILLRKLALREGNQYVFEPNDSRFQRRIQLAFERRLRRMLEGGALTAFQVVTGDAVNTRSDYDSGRLVIEIKVAPSQPVEFITVVLLRSGEDLLDVVER